MTNESVDDEIKKKREMVKLSRPHVIDVKKVMNHRRLSM